jgi:hypothetical protein
MLSTRPPPPARCSAVCWFRWYRDPQALIDYVHQMLTAAQEPGITTPYQATAGLGGGDAQQAAAEVATAIARRATARSGAQSFLIARLLALSVRTRPELLNC